MIIVKLFGGIGNQMFQYAAGRRLAKFNNSELKLDITHYDQLILPNGLPYRSYDLSIFNIKESIANKKEIDLYKHNSNSISKRVIKKTINYFSPHIEKIESQFNFSPEILHLKGNIYLDGYWQSEKYFEDIEDIIRTDFRIKTTLTNEGYQLLEKIKNTNSVCLNIRRQEFASNRYINQFVGEDYINNAIELMTKKINNPHFFIFSDELSWCKHNLKISQEHTFVEEHLYGDRYRDCLFLMSSCKNFIIPNSTFGWWGAWLNNNQKKTVVAPKKWLNDPIRNTNDVLPESWIKNINMQYISPVTIVMPAYNAEKHIKQAIDSVLNQTFSEFIFMIINDGSTDKTEEIILSYRDHRINYIKNKNNIGLVNTLNKSIDLTQTEYYARMDADDICFPERLEWQLDFMKNNPDIGICGGMIEIFGGKNSQISNFPITNEDIKVHLLFSNPISHPTVLFRREILKNNKINFGVPFQYDDTYGHKILELEDFALWHKLKSVTQFANLERVLIKYRKEGQNLSDQKSDLILERKKKYYTYLLNELNVKASENNLLFHISLSFFHKSKSVEDIRLFKDHLNELIAANKISKIYSQLALERLVKQKWDQLFYHIAPKGLKYVFYYWKNSKKIKQAHFVYFLKASLNNVLHRK